MNIYIVRHCKAEGQSPDANLTDAGYTQAEKLAEFLHDKKIVRIVSSPFVRAHQSILPLAQRLNLTVETDERLAERVLCGGNHPNWREMLRESFEDLDLFFEGGESGNAAMNRAVSVVQEVRNRGNNNVVIVSHGNLIALLLKYYDNQVGFEEWEALSNPDVHLLNFGDELPRITRVWTD